MPTEAPQPKCYLCSRPLQFKGKTRRVRDENGKPHDEEAEPAETFMSLPLYKDGKPVVNPKTGIQESAWVHLKCYQAPPEEALVPPPPYGLQQKLL